MDAILFIITNSFSVALLFCGVMTFLSGVICGMLLNQALIQHALKKRGMRWDAYLTKALAREERRAKLGKHHPVSGVD